MKDRLEDFIRDHSAEFDLREPDLALWGKIEKNITAKKVINWRFYLSRAAVVLLIFGATIMGQRLWVKEGIPGKKQEAINIVIPELQEAEVYYSSLITQKLQEVKPLLDENPSLEHELKADLGELDSIYKSLKSDLKDNIANDEVIEAMIQNYRLRISILEDMLTYLKSNEENDSINNTDYEL